MDRWSSLREQVDGQLRRPGEPGFAAATDPVNERYRERRPAAALSVAHPRDVAVALRWCREHDVAVVARGGGHGYAGAATTTGLVLDLAGLDGIRIEPDRDLVTVGGGVRTGALQAALHRHGRALPLGNADDVAIGGLTLGGGVSVISRAYGLVCDLLTGTDVVLADGRAVPAGATEHEDLFWACRGGGGGTFGVHTSFSFRTVPEPDSVSTCLLLWDWAAAAKVLPVLQTLMAAAPRAFSARIGASRAPGEAGLVSLVGQHLGPATELLELVRPALAAAPTAHRVIADRSYADAVRYLHHGSAGGAFAVRTRCLPGPLPDAGVETLLSAVEKWPGGSNPDGAGFALFTWGGAIAEIAPAETAFPHRDTRFLLSLDTSWTAQDSAETREAALTWLTALYEEMGAFCPDGAYVNFADPELADWAGAYYGPNLPRLRDVKRRYDPDRLFSGAQIL